MKRDPYLELIRALDVPAPPGDAPAIPDDIDDDVDAFLQGLDVPAPPALAPSLPDELPPAIPPHPIEQPAPANRAWIGLLALAAALLVVVLLPRVGSDEEFINRRGSGDIAVSATLGLNAVQGGESRRLTEDATLLPGEIVYFEISATPASEVLLWVDAPSGRLRLGSLPATPIATAAVTPRGHLAYAPDDPGRHTFTLGLDEETILQQVTVEVAP